jgi:chorismate dehydratase
MDVISRPPSVLNQLMAEGRLDISSVSSSAYARNSRDWLILPNLSISCYGKVMSVLAVSDCPFEKLNGKSLILTDESATAVDLLQLIFAKKNIAPCFEKGKITSPADLKKTADAGLIIGDSALRHNWRNHFNHVWDLCEIWNQMTGLPFVFGIWVVRRSFAQEHPQTTAQILDALNQSRMDGLANLSSIIEAASKKLNIPVETCNQYYRCMTYNLGDSEGRALSEFFKGLYDRGIISESPLLSFYNHPAGATGSQGRA